VKFRGELGEIPGSINESTLTTGIHLMAILCEAAEHSVIDKRKV